MHSEDLAMYAKISVSSVAGWATAAVNSGVRNDTAAFQMLLVSVTNLFYPAAELMPHDQRRGAARACCPKGFQF
jgi:hypothetical protein